MICPNLESLLQSSRQGLFDVDWKRLTLRSRGKRKSNASAGNKTKSSDNFLEAREQKGCAGAVGVVEQTAA
jgi:hypothetical protein